MHRRYNNYTINIVSFPLRINNYYKNKINTSCLHHCMLISFIIIFCEKLHRKVTKNNGFLWGSNWCVSDCKIEHAYQTRLPVEPW